MTSYFNQNERLHKQNNFFKESLRRIEKDLAPTNVFYTRDAQYGGQGGPGLARRMGRAMPGLGRAKPEPGRDCHALSGLRS